ncbi:hypothetical protein [Spirosoma litoris]
MALDIYWQEGRSKTRIGQIEVDDVFDKLIFQYERQAGIHVDLYGHSRLYASQWEQLITLAHQTNFDAVQLEAVQAKLPVDASEGILILEGD